MKDLYRLAFDEPLLFVSSLHEDDAYPKRYKKPYGKPELIKNMRKFLKEMDSLLQNMYLLGRDSNVKINKRQREILSRLGIHDYDKLPAAWAWMANRPESNNIEFAYCLFDRDYPYTSDIYANFLGESAFRKLEDWMIARGYKRYNIYDVTASDCKLSLTYANPLWDKHPPGGGFEYKIKHTGISVIYEPTIRNPVVLGLCIPNGLKTYLNAFDLVDEKTRGFVIDRTKKCDGCGYCIQTDKTGSRPLAHIPVDYEGKKYNLCPYFPGYWTCSITRLVIEQVLRKTWVSRGNPRFSSSLNGCCSETEVSEQLY
ncbi:MAG: hypothetical protein LBH51_00390, partial [Treponema sp.]|nr:hypothetical protein [Treponema sp.]